MKFLRPRREADSTAALGGVGLYRGYTAGSVFVSESPAAGTAPLAREGFRGFGEQLVDDGYATLDDGVVTIPWDGLFAALPISAYDGLGESLQLPSLTTARPRLVSRGSLTDESFAIEIEGWSRPGGRTQPCSVTGAVLYSGEGEELLSEAQWRLVQSVGEFAKRVRTSRDAHDHRIAWGRIRSLAVAASADLDDFLYRSVVITPERLSIELRRSVEIRNDAVVEIEPSFDGVPDGWLARFDSARGVQDRYDIPTAEGIVQVVITAPVRAVLESIKAMPGRRVAGSRAQAFLANPFAVLGGDPEGVLSEDQLAAAKEAAGIRDERFRPLVERDTELYPHRVGVLVESSIGGEDAESARYWLDDASLNAFIAKARSNVRSNYQFIAWNGYDLAIDGDTEASLDLLERALRDRRTPRVQIRYDDIHDLTRYTPRVDGIGHEKPIYSIYIARKDDTLGWFPENLQPLVAYNPSGGGDETVLIPDDTWTDDLRREVDSARREGRPTVSIAGQQEPISLLDADRMLETYDAASADAAKGTFVPPSRSGVPSSRPKAKRLILRANIDAIEYAEERRTALHQADVSFSPPRCLRQAVVLHDHQRAGISWLQHLHSLRDEYSVRGAVLADDMGLGKTLQLLTFIASVVERDPAVAPILVVAPVALLENWIEEVEKFFEPGVLKLQIAYGPALGSLRLSRDEIDRRLQSDDGLDRFLRSGWIGDANVVLTTYETLRDYEFSFASETWSIMVCDEAQRIKNPSAIVTRAAKKLKVQFRIACTGTPVENSLADLWCLFDYVQPGLLGALNEFGAKYRRPIEAKTEEQHARVEELRRLIAPQILRRTKTEVAKDLPPKTIVSECRSLSLSATQRQLYEQAMSDFGRRKLPGAAVPFKNHLGLLQYFRRICTDPQRYGQTVFQAETLDDYRKKAPKLHWLLGLLADIRRRDEKVIVFCEVREIQRLLQHYINESLGVAPEIVNGDTNASADHAVSRQKRIKAFQRKPGFGVIILSPLAVGFGVNIQAANHVVHYTRTWNPAKEDQATDRAYRIGQTKEVFVYYPVVVADDFTTFDAKLDRLLDTKRALAGDMLNGDGGVDASEFDIDEIAPPNPSGTLDVRITIEDVARMDAKYFECFLAVLWSKQGFETYLTPSSGDQGIDVVGIRDQSGVLIQAKSSGATGIRLGWEAVKDVVTGSVLYERRHSHVSFTKVCVCNQEFNANAREMAKAHNVVMVDRSDLEALVSQFEVMESDVANRAFGSSETA